MTDPKEWKDEETRVQVVQREVMNCPVCEGDIEHCNYDKCDDKPFRPNQEIVCALDTFHYHKDCFREQKEEDEIDHNYAKYGD